jgi:hypothetical protein
MKRGACNSPKMKALGRELAELLDVDPMIGRHIATSLLHRLWEWASEYSPSGSLEGIDLDDLAEALHWTDRLEPVLEAMLREKSRWLDRDERGLRIHDWPDHCEHYVHKRLARAREYFADGSEPKLTRLDNKAEVAEIAAWYEARRAERAAATDGEAAEQPPEDQESGRPASAQRAPGERPSGAPAMPCLAMPCRIDREEVKDPVELARGAPAPPLSLLEHVKKPSAPPGPGRRDYRADASAKAPACLAAAAQRGRQWKALKGHRLNQMAACLAMFPDDDPEILVQAIHGAIAYWKATMPPGTKVTAYLTPDAVFNRERFEKYVEAYHDASMNPAIAARHAPPPEPAKPALSPEQRDELWSKHFDENGRSRRTSA